MKFGKELLRAAEVSDKIVAQDCWIDYKVLKKMLKHSPLEQQEPPHENEKELITHSEVERRFFLALRAELHKVETRFSELRDSALLAAEDFLKVPENEDPQELLHMCADTRKFTLRFRGFLDDIKLWVII
jgi:SPX domain protein involved in polyphosphate accumulation